MNNALRDRLRGFLGNEAFWCACAAAMIVLALLTGVATPQNPFIVRNASDPPNVLDLSNMSIDAAGTTVTLGVDLDVNGKTQTDELDITGDGYTLNSDATGTGADQTFTIQRSATGMTGPVTLTLPIDDGLSTEGLATDGNGVLSWIDFVTTAELARTTNPTGASLVGIRSQGATTERFIQDAIDTLLSSGMANGGGIISDAGGATIDVSAGFGYLRNLPLDSADVFNINFPASTGIAISTDTFTFVGVEWNAGTPQVFTTTDVTDFNFEDNFFLGDVLNDSGTLFVVNSPWNVGGAIGNVMHRWLVTEPVRIDVIEGGLALGETGTRNLTLTGGNLWHILTEFPIGPLDTSVSDTFDIYFRDGSGGFTRVGNETQWDNDSFDDGTGVLATLGNNKFGVLWFYVEVSGDLIAQYGRESHNNAAAAELEAVPNTAPLRLGIRSILIARLIFQESAAVSTSIDSTFETSFTSSGITDHGDLANIEVGDDHIQYFLLDGTKAITGTTTFDGVATDITTTSGEHLNLAPGGAGFVGIKEATPLAELHITDTAVNGSTQIRLENDAQVWGMSTAGVFGDAFLISNVTSATLPFTIATSAITASMTIDATGVGIFNAAPAQALDVIGNVVILPTVSAGITIRESDDGGDAVQIVGAATAGAITLFSGGNLSISLPGAGPLIFNEQGLAGNDFRVEGDTEPNLFFVDASTDRVGIGVLAPAFRLEVSGTPSSIARFHRDTNVNNSSLIMNYALDDSGGAITNYARVLYAIVDNTDGSEDGRIVWNVLSGGSNVEPLRITALEVTVNEGSRAMDFRVEGDTQVSGMLYDSSDSAFHINDSTGAGDLNVGATSEYNDGDADWTVTSGRRFKRNIVERDGLTWAKARQFAQIPVSEWEYDPEQFPEMKAAAVAKRRVSVMADDFGPWYGSVATESINYSEMGVSHTELIQVLIREVQILKQRLAAL